MTREPEPIAAILPRTIRTLDEIREARIKAATERFEQAVSDCRKPKGAA